MDYKMVDGVLVPVRKLEKMNRVFPMRVWIWICPICTDTAKKLAKHCTAAANGRHHLRYMHFVDILDPITIKAFKTLKDKAELKQCCQKL